jgi:hypothetical protein
LNVDLGLFKGDVLLHRCSIQINPNEETQDLENLKIRHQLLDEMAEVEILIFECGEQVSKSSLSVPIHESDDWESIELGEFTLAFWCRLNT